MTTPAVRQLAVQGGKALVLRHIAGFIINFSGGVILARFLGPETLGLYFISYTVLIVSRQIIDFGFSVRIISAPTPLSESEENAIRTFQQFIAFFAIVVITLIAYVIGSIYSHWELSILLVSAAIGAYFYSWQSVPVARLERKLEYPKVGWIEVTEIFTFNIIAGIGAIAGSGIIGLSLGNVLRGLGPAVLTVLLTGAGSVFTKDWYAHKSLAREALPVVGVNLVVWIIMFAPPVLLSAFSTLRALGIAQLGYTLLGYPMVLATIVQRVGLAALSRLQHEKEAFHKAVERVLSLLFVTFVPVIIAIASFSPLWIPWLYGPQWLEMQDVIIVGVVPVTASALLTIFVSAFLAQGLSHLVFVQNLIHAALYWSVMAASAAALGALSVPVAHLVAMFAGIIFLLHYRRRFGALSKLFLSLFLAMTVTTAVSWWLVKQGNIVFPILLWILFMVFAAYRTSSARYAMDIFLRGKTK